MSRKLLSFALALTLVFVFCLSAIFTGGTSVDAEISSASATRVAKTAARTVEHKTQTTRVESVFSAPAATETEQVEDEAADETEEDADSQKDSQEDISNLTPSSSNTSVLSVGTVSASDVRLREGAGTDASILATLGKGTVVSIKSKENGWYKVNYDGKDGYMSADFVTSRETADDLTGYARVDTDVLNMRAESNAASEKVCSIAKDVYVTVTGFRDGWYAVSYGNYSGYMSGDYLTPVAEKPQPKPTTSTPSSSTSSSTSSSSSTSTQSGGSVQVSSSGSGNSSMVQYAMSFLGVPYVYGGASPSGFDCSGFTMYVYSHFGYSLPHGSNGQYRMGTVVNRSSLVAGDLVFFLDYRYGSGPTSHVGIYIGDGQFIHATSYGGKVRLSSLNDSYYSSAFVGGRHFG